jgi:cytochrome P450
LAPSLRIVKTTGPVVSPTLAKMASATAMADVDLTDLDNFAAGLPHHLFELHRREAPVWHHQPTGHTPDGEPFWSVATYDDVLHVLRNPTTFSSERGGHRRHGGTLLQDMEVAGSVLTMMDDPRHARLRRLVSTGLTPRRAAVMEDDLRRRARALVDAIEPGQPIDFVERVAGELPMQVICSLLGVPEKDRHQLIEAVDPAFDVPEGDSGARLADAAITQAHTVAYAGALIAEKRERPTDDMLSVVIHASMDEVDPPTLSELELYAFFFLLFSAGSETTRNAIAGGLLALLERPQQLEHLRADPELLPSFVEEVLRWTTPSPAQRRTATCTTVLGGHIIEPGDKVLIWEGSANRDEAVFDRPADFDIRRDPNPHLTFGHGVHHCLGASLARLEIRVLFAELLPRFASYQLLEPAEWTRSNRHIGLRHLHVAFTST